MTDLRKNLTTMKSMLFLLVFGLFMNGALYASKVENKAAIIAKKKTTVTGVASWYGKGFHGKKTANGEIFRMEKFTCASNKFPLGTWLKITNSHNGKTAIVKVNDRMHPRMTRLVDVSKSVAVELGFLNSGTAKVTVESFGKSLPASFR